MQDPSHYPVSGFGPAIPGMVIGGMGIVHVFVAQFAVGAGALLLWLERLAGRGDEVARRFLDGYFVFLVLVSFVFGALTGVGMWLTAVQVSAPTISAMVREFHWLWAAEWCFFLLEVVAGYLFYRYRERLTHRTRMHLLGLYAFASWMSLFLINGILSWQLTPGAWLQTHSIWHGFFNPSFWPSLVYRTLVAWTLAGLVAVFVVHFVAGLSKPERQQLQRKVAWCFAPTATMPLVGIWFLWVMPADSRSWLLGGSVAMTMFLAIAVGASTLLGIFAVVGVFLQRLAIERATAALLLALAFAATAAGEFVRARLKRAPFVLEVRDLWPDSIVQLGQLKSGLLIRLMEGMETLLYRSAAGIVVVTAAFEKHVTQRGIPPERIRRIYNGIDTGRFHPRPAEPSLLEKHDLAGRFLVAYVGTLGLAHGLGTLLDAAERLRGHQDILFLFIGDGADRARLEAEAAERQLSNVRFLGLRPRDEIPAWLASIDILLVMLRDLAVFETVIPSKLFEFLAQERPVILAARGEVRTMLEEAEAGLSIDPEDPEALANAVLHVRAYPEQAARRASAGREWVERDFVREDLATEMATFLDQVAHHRLP